MDNPTIAELGNEPRFVQMPGGPARRASQELLEGLQAAQAHIAPKFLYDALGSSLFTAITQLPEYYPTRCEAEIFDTHGADIARHAGPLQAMIDLGAGDCSKAQRLLEFLRPAQYVPIDISADYLQDAVARLHTLHPELEIVALGLDFSETLALPSGVRPKRRLFVYPGSSIGNLDGPQALAMLERIRTGCPDGGLLVGVDRVKPREILEPAYDDALGVTAAFNLNLLRHVNALAGTDFHVEDWKHVAFYNPALERVEMHLEARRPARVAWPGGQRAFGPGERIHTESSYKYQPEGFSAMLERAGFSDIRHWTDERSWFSVFHARA